MKPNAKYEAVDISNITPEQEDAIVKKSLVETINHLTKYLQGVVNTRNAENVERHTNYISAAVLMLNYYGDNGEN